MAIEAVDTGEVAAMLGVSRQRVHQIRSTHSDFPAPIIERPRAIFWRLRDVQRWGVKHGYIDKEG